MSNSMFFLPCICIIICFIISAITYTYNKAKDRAVDKANNDDIHVDNDLETKCMFERMIHENKLNKKNATWSMRHILREISDEEDNELVDGIIRKLERKNMK